MHHLSDLLRAAAAAVPPEYFVLPIHGADPVYRERVYCYELDHQMRRLWPQPGTGNNHAVFEVKSALGSDDATTKDFETLLHFRQKLR